MRKTLTAGLTALSLILVPATPVHADTHNDALGQAIVGLLAAGVIGLAISKNRDRDDDNAQRSTVQHNGYQQPRHAQTQRFGDDDRRTRDVRGLGHGRRADALPGRCFRQIELRNGRVQNVFAARCLERRYRDVDSLPRQCLTRLGGRDGSNLGYDASCLRDRGYRSDRRW